VEDIQSDLNFDELACLRLIRMQGHPSSRLTAERLRARGLIVEDQGRMQLSREGRRALVRGSPALWTLVA
jgi:hypothetical protein